MSHPRSNFKMPTIANPWGTFAMIAVAGILVAISHLKAGSSVIPSTTTVVKRAP